MKAAALFAAGIFALTCPAVWAQSAGPNDAQIAAIVVTANQVDIDAGKLAASKSSNKEVKEFAQRMVTDHTGVNKAATELVTKLKVKPEPNATSKELKKAGDDTLKRLKALKGTAFDKAYVDNEVTYHRITRAICSGFGHFVKSAFGIACRFGSVSMMLGRIEFTRTCAPSF